MSYLDTTLTPASGYTYVNFKQTYDTIAAQLTAHAAWEFVESVDWVSGANTFRTFVWKNLSSVSGLASDFYVAFRLQFVTATGEYQTTGLIGLQVMLFEVYDSVGKVASKIAPWLTSTPAVILSDHSHPNSWTLTTNNQNIMAHTSAAHQTSATSMRYFIGVTNDVIFIANTQNPQYQTYVGAMETLMSATDDPTPLVLASGWYNGFGGNMSSAAGHISSTRHPKLTGSSAYSFGFGAAPWHQTSVSGFLGSTPMVYPAASTAAGILGDPSNTAYSMFLNGVVTSKVPVASAGNGQTGSTRGGLRGYLKYLRAAQAAAHSAGDTFDIDGVAYLGFGAGVYGLWDTSA